MAALHLKSTVIKMLVPVAFYKIGNRVTKLAALLTRNKLGCTEETKPLTAVQVTESVPKQLLIIPIIFPVALQARAQKLWPIKENIPVLRRRNLFHKNASKQMTNNKTDKN
jgi:hypothetical protein